jgi:hypothetical protein
VITHTVVANEPLAAHGYETSETREARKTHEREAQERAQQRSQQRSRE